MSQFNYDQYNALINRASEGAQQSVKIGFFKLKDDGDEALVRINCKDLEDLQFASVHTVNAAGKWMKVSCHNPVGSYTGDCPLCAANVAGNTAISKAGKKVYVQMLVAYRDKVTGEFSAPIPVIWERPAGFSREIANKLRDYGDLRSVLLKVTRNGKAGDMKTTYSMDYAVPTVFKPELIPADFSAFVNFNIAKHSYWEKSVGDINTFLATGSFPEIVKQDVSQSGVSGAPTVVQDTPYVTPTAASTQVVHQQVTQSTPSYTAPANVNSTPVVEQPKQEESRPTRNFTGWSF